MTVINAPLVGVINILEALVPDLGIPILLPSIKGFLFNYIYTNVLDKNAEFKDDLFHDFRVDDILWTGYNPGIMKFFFNITDVIEDVIETNFNISIHLEDYFPAQIQDRTLAYFRDKNDTDANSFYKINRGRHDKGKYCMIEELNGKPELPNWWWPNIPVSPTAQQSGVKGTSRVLFAFSNS